MKASDTDKVKE